jgi:hypothetical protein
MVLIRVDAVAVQTRQQKLLNILKQLLQRSTSRMYQQELFTGCHSQQLLLCAAQVASKLSAKLLCTLLLSYSKICSTFMNQ